MRNNYNLNSLEELKARRLALKSESIMYGESVFNDAKGYVAKFSIDRIRSPKADAKSMLSSRILSYALPIVMNKTLFKNSGLITKTVIGMISSKTGTRVGGLLINYLTPKNK